MNFSIVSFTELLIIDGNEYNKPLKIVTSVLNFFKALHRVICLVLKQVSVSEDFWDKASGF